MDKKAEEKFRVMKLEELNPSCLALTWRTRAEQRNADELYKAERQVNRFSFRVSRRESRPIDILILVQCYQCQTYRPQNCKIINVYDFKLVCNNLLL